VGQCHKEADFYLGGKGLIRGKKDEPADEKKGTESGGVLGRFQKSINQKGILKAPITRKSGL